jgi:hypothetical protein
MITEEARKFLSERHLHVLGRILFECSVPRLMKMDQQGHHLTDTPVPFAMLFSSCVLQHCSLPLWFIFVPEIVDFAKYFQYLILSPPDRWSILWFPILSGWVYPQLTFNDTITGSPHFDTDSYKTLWPSMTDRRPTAVVGMRYILDG